jgi:hypothetical protein
MNRSAMGLLWGAAPRPRGKTRDTSPGPGPISDKFAATLLSEAYVTLGHSVQNSLTLS